jgi:hypothetical protein
MPCLFAVVAWYVTVRTLSIFVPWYTGTNSVPVKRGHSRLALIPSVPYCLISGTILPFCIWYLSRCCVVVSSMTGVLDSFVVALTMGNKGYCLVWNGLMYAGSISGTLVPSSTSDAEG